MVLLLIYSFTFNLILCSERLHRMFNLILIPQGQCYYGLDLSEHEANDNRSVIDCKKTHAASLSRDFLATTRLLFNKLQHIYKYRVHQKYQT